MYKYTLILWIMAGFIVSCKTNQNTTAEPIKDSPLEIINQKVKTGIDVLQESNFDFLKGKRVGLVTNPTGVNATLKSTVDILFEHPEVNLVALFGPEHGVRGNFSAGDEVGNNRDEKTGLPVYSLYGKNHKPDKSMLDSIDILVYDIQDIGVRSYTYISTMGLIMEAAAENDKQVLILDRPNPLGGNHVEGTLVSDGYYSFVSQYNIPYVYGLTCGELALMLNNEGMLKNGVKCDLQVVKMENYRSNMTFDETGLIWVPTSPHIPTWECAFYYACTGILGELDPNAIGIGYTLPFQTLVNENFHAQQLSEAMNALNLLGVIFRPIIYKPYYKDKMGTELQGVQIHISDFKQVNLTEIQFRFMETAHRLYPSYDPFKGKTDRYRMFDYGCGSDNIRKKLMQNFSFTSIESVWRNDLATFNEMSKKYKLYQ